MRTIKMEAWETLRKYDQSVLMQRLTANPAVNSTVAPRPEPNEYLRTRPRRNCKLRQMLVVPISYFVIKLTALGISALCKLRHFANRD